MRSQVLCIEQLQTAIGQVVRHLAHVHQLTTRKDVLLDEVSDAGTELLDAHGRGGDAVVEHQPAGLEQAAQAVEVVAELRAPHVLEHAHRGDAIKRLGHAQVAVVEQLHLDATAQAALVDEPVDMGVLMA